MQPAGRAALQQLGLLSCQQAAAVLQQHAPLLAAACSSSSARCIASHSVLPAFQAQSHQQQAGSGADLRHTSSRRISSSSAASSSSNSSSSKETTTASSSSQPAESMQQIRARIFEQHIGDGRRSGRAVLLRPLKGRHIASWYFTLTGPQLPMLEDDIEEERLLKVQLARATGSGPPKKGQGKRAGKKK
uniref:Small ribosomal subunit protein mS33 n=2 Tax=Tetradesmus obliquus TaxID=3088 RepID=A0A383W5H6_TETOB|eukprot:jgi/Sobl393_1/17081/SZX72399.1